MLYYRKGISRDRVGHPPHMHIHTKTWNQELAQVLGLGICRVKQRKQKTALEEDYQSKLMKVLFICLH